MSVEAMAIVLHHSRAAGTQKVILLGIANHDGDGGSWPSIKTLARYANVNERAAQYALRILEDGLGEIRIHTQAGGGAKMRDELRPNMYEIVLSCPDSCDGTRHHGVKPSAPDPVQTSAPDPVQTSAPGQGSVEARPGASTCTPPVKMAAPEPSLNRVSPSEKHTGRSSSTPALPRQRSRATPAQRRQRQLQEEIQAAIEVERRRAGAGDPEAERCVHNLTVMSDAGQFEQALFWWRDCELRAPLPGQSGGVEGRG